MSLHNKMLEGQSSYESPWRSQGLGISFAWTMHCGTWNVTYRSFDPCQVCMISVVCNLIQVISTSKRLFVDTKRMVCINRMIYIKQSFPGPIEMNKIYRETVFDKLHKPLSFSIFKGVTDEVFLWNLKYDCYGNTYRYVTADWAPFTNFD